MKGVTKGEETEEQNEQDKDFQDYKNVAKVTRISWCLANENSVHENSRCYTSFPFTTRCSGGDYLTLPSLATASLPADSTSASEPGIISI